METMSLCHLFCVILTTGVILTGSFFVGSFHKDMMMYDEGNTYSCSKDIKGEWIGSVFSDLQYQGSSMTEDFVSQELTENMFFDPLKCFPLYKNEDERPIWFGRVENMDFKNQHIFVYGYVVTVNPNESNKKPFEVQWTFDARSKMKKWEGWQYLLDEKIFNTGTVTAHCRDD